MLHPVTHEPIKLTKEQQTCVDYVGDKRKDLVIRSAAGGGKSLVLLNRAMKYLKDRGLSAETIRKFGLGYAGQYSDSLSRYLKKQGQTLNTFSFDFNV